ncbi:MAG TPA: hypothetical protein VLM76_14485 [Patescibacteria group bacterium]|nr:hypothetical protein [Patescibacteria group bacterium]
MRIVVPAKPVPDATGQEPLRSDVPPVEHADLYVVGDLFAIVSALVAAPRARAT